jgi:hypothetical protein
MHLRIVLQSSGAQRLFDHPVEERIQQMQVAKKLKMRKCIKVSETNS